MSTSAMAWMATAVGTPQLQAVQQQLAGGKLEQSKQATKALKCVAFTNMQVGSLMGRKRERLERRLKAVAAEIRLLEADMLENLANREVRRAQMDDTEDDRDQARALGNAALEQELADELQLLRDEDAREQVLFRNLKKAARARRRVHAEFLDEQRALEEATAAFHVKQNLIQTLLASCTKRSPSNCNTASSSASESECGSSDHGDGGLDLDLAAAGNSSSSHSSNSNSEGAAAGSRSPSPRREPVRSSLRWSSTNSDTDSQASSQATKRSRTVSFSPLPPTEYGAPSDSDASGDEHAPRRRPYPQRLQVRVYAHHEQGEELSDGEDESEVEVEDDASESSGSGSDEDEEQSPAAAAASPVRSDTVANEVSIEEAARVE